MDKLNHKELLKAGVHFGHLTRKWNPKMAEYIFMEQNGIHLIDLNRTIDCAFTAVTSLKNIVKSGRKVMFVATKKQAKDYVSKIAKKLNMPFVTERWLGGMLTNFSTIRKSLKKLSSYENQMNSENFESDFRKKEKLTISREKAKLEKVLGGITSLSRIPAAIFIVDIKFEEIALKEAKKLNLPIYGLVDTNSNPNLVDFPIPANDDSFNSISFLLDYVAKGIQEGLDEREKLKEEIRIKEEKEAALKEKEVTEQAMKEKKETLKSKKS